MNPNTDTLTLLRDAVSRRKKRRDETPREYASTIASIIHRGWSFLGKDAKWFNERVDEVENLLA